MARKKPARKLMAGPDRDKVAADLKAQYESGASIRSIAEATSRSYGGVHRLLADAGVRFRSRGGELRKKAGA
ncbi:transcriptional regulator [Streptomyces sp. ISL-10]|uniref:helix-turn-helix domain-containing protein n=1 Tax=Streptomyces sp. ISL-10 TaxID=2819172 RepID=UPI001BE88333|nr:helix-turn-helix domain-containing protein [Streptomyces sp. ISL-10]MBT2369382.1 transcriptional regulator [Streptomyces sp. ISL-10]